jgi:hypothetical protein
MDTPTTDSFAEAMGNFTVDRVKNRLKRIKAIIDGNDFQDCPAKGIRDAWEALIEVEEIVAAGLCILVERRHARHPRTSKDWFWALLDRSPVAAALVFLGVVLAKIHDVPILSVFGLGGD